MENYLQVIGCPISQYIYLNPLQAKNVSKYVSIREFTFMIASHVDVPIGSVGLNPVYCENLKVAIGDIVTVHAINPANIYPCCAMTFSVIRYSDPTINYNAIQLDTLARGIPIVYPNHVFKSGQLVPLVYGTSAITCRVSGPGEIGEMLTSDTRIKTIIESKITFCIIL
jgi:hypothetical protein